VLDIRVIYKNTPPATKPATSNITAKTATVRLLVLGLGGLGLLACGSADGGLLADWGAVMLSIFILFT